MRAFYTHTYRQLPRTPQRYNPILGHPGRPSFQILHHRLYHLDVVLYTLYSTLGDQTLATDLGSILRPLPLFLHCGLEAEDIDLCTPLGGYFLRDLQGEPEGVVQEESLRSRYQHGTP